MASMESRCERAERLLVSVETTHGSGDFAIDPRLLVEEVWQRSDADTGSARISVRLTDAEDSEEVRRCYHPDRRLAISTEDPDPERRVFLFEGYPPMQSSRWDGRIEREGEAYLFEAEHVWERYSRARESWVYGRRMRSGSIEDGCVAQPSAYAARSEHFTALPCVFNPEGLANRAVEPLRMDRPDGTQRHVHFFAAQDGTGVKWTYATVLRYLVHFYLGTLGPVFEGNVFGATEALAMGEPGEANTLVEGLSREPVSLSCEGVSLCEALALLSSAAGLHVTADTLNVASRPRTVLRVWSPRDGALRKLYLVRGGRHTDGAARYDPRQRTVREVLRDNNTYRGEVGWDHRSIVNHALVVGDVKRYELTMPLWPGWRPRENLDNVLVEHREVAKLMALTPDQVKALGSRVIQYEWYRRYHRDGLLYNQNAEVGRSWVLNEDGAFSAADYNRNFPFDHYQPFDFATVLPAGELGSSGWTRRRRPLARTLSVGADGESLGVWVEISFDFGMNWSAPGGPVGVLSDRAGIRFEVDNLTQITPPGAEPGWQNLWYALIDQSFRVRVTAVIEGDDRLLATFGPDALDSPTLQVNTAMIRRPGSFRFASRTLGSSVLYPALTGGLDERDDSEAVRSLAEWLARSRQDRQVRLAPVIPWIETSYAIGERVTELAGRCLRFATTVGADLQYPSITERRFMLQKDGRYETLLTLASADLPENVI